MPPLRIAIIGAGNVAWHLAPALDRKAGIVEQVFSRTFSHAKALSDRLSEAKAIDNINDIDPNLDLYVICLRDEAIPEIAASMPKVNGIVVHTSGSIDISYLRDISNNQAFGVFYPLQTFSKSADVNVSEVPFFTEASSPAVLSSLDALALKIGASVNHADSHQRGQLHIAAVFACNFANHLWSISADLLAKEGYKLDVLRPLLEATLSKAMAIGPREAQTGPASRGDTAVIEKHISSLSPHNALIYQIISQSISQQSTNTTQK